MKICIGLSGGVDSSVAALLLKQQGFDVFAMFMQNWHDTEGTLHGDCEWEEDRFIAEMVARKIGIPFYFVDLSSEYRKRVVDYMFDEYAKGRTPNPDVLCNREIKFDAFWNAARKLGADAVATGHYCRSDSIIAENGQKVYRIFEGCDPGKDQSYFLCQLTQKQLANAIFPIGGLLKSEVRRIAKEADLPSAEKKDSQGICFVGKVDLPVFLQQKLKSVEGDVVEVFDTFYHDYPLYRRQQEILKSLLQSPESALVSITSYISEDKSIDSTSKKNVFDSAKFASLADDELLAISEPLEYNTIHFETETYRSGKHHIRKQRYKANPYAKVLGKHEGAQFYTIGQRKGLNIGGHDNPLFVIATDVVTNTVYVGEGHDHKGLSRSCLRIKVTDLHWIRPDLEMSEGETRRYRVRVRYRQPLQDATLLMKKNALYILFDSPQRGITPGQFAVWYDGEEMLGSGII